MKTVWWSK